MMSFKEFYLQTSKAPNKTAKEPTRSKSEKPVIKFLSRLRAIQDARRAKA